MKNLIAKLIIWAVLKITQVYERKIIIIPGGVYKKEKEQNKTA